jgi:hypothetical protein
MNTIESFTYVVTSTDEASGTMELVYSSPNLPDVLVGALMPRGSQTLDDVAASFAPMKYWMDLINPVVSVSVGSTNVIVISRPDEQTQPVTGTADSPFNSSLPSSVI